MKLNKRIIMQTGLLGLVLLGPIMAINNQLDHSGTIKIICEEKQTIKKSAITIDKLIDAETLNKYKNPNKETSLEIDINSLMSKEYGIDINKFDFHIANLDNGDLILKTNALHPRETHQVWVPPQYGSSGHWITVVDREPYWGYEDSPVMINVTFDEGILEINHQNDGFNDWKDFSISEKSKGLRVIGTNYVPNNKETFNIPPQEINFINGEARINFSDKKLKPLSVEISKGSKFDLYRSILFETNGNNYRNPEFWNNEGQKGAWADNNLFQGATSIDNWNELSQTNKDALQMNVANDKIIDYKNEAKEILDFKLYDKYNEKSDRKENGDNGSGFYSSLNTKLLLSFKNDNLIFSVDNFGISKQPTKIKTPNIKFNAKSLIDYNYASSQINLKATQENIDNKLIDSKVPFLWSGSEFSYLQFEEVLKNNLVSNTDPIPLGDELKVSFYTDAEGKNEITSKTEYINTRNIYFKFSGSGRNEHIFGETEIQHLVIPYVNVELHETAHNIYPSDENDEYDLAGNKDHYEWNYENGKWNLYTNQPFELVGNYKDINWYQVGSNKVELWEGQNLDLTHKQIENNSSVSVNHTIDLNTNEMDDNEKFSFGYHYQSEEANKEFIKITQLNGAIDKDNDNKLKTFDNNANGQIDNDELFNVTTVNTPFTFKIDGVSNEPEKLEMYNGGVDWNQIPTNDINNHNLKPGLYRIIDENDKYHNTQEKLINFVDDTKGDNNDLYQLNDWDYTNEDYVENLRIAISQGMTKDQFDNLTSKEQRKIESTIDSTDMIDLSKISIKNENLEKITNTYKNDSVSLDKIKPELDYEIDKQMQETHNIPKEDYVIEWLTPGDELLNSESKLEYNIIPSGNWKTKNNYSKYFYAKTWSDIGDVSIPREILEPITNKYEQGTNFKPIRKELESKIRSIYKEQGMSSEDIDFEWTHTDTGKKFNDTDKVYYDSDLEWKATANGEVIKGVNEDNEITSGTFYNLRNLKIDNDKLQTISIEKDGSRFEDIKKDLNEEINLQLSKQGYPTDWVRVEWDMSDEEIIYKDTEITYTLTSRNEQYMKNSLRHTIDWGIVPIEKDPTKALTTVGIVILSILSFAILFLLIIFINKQLQKMKNNSNEKRNNKSINENKRLKELEE